MNCTAAEAEFRAALRGLGAEAEHHEHVGFLAMRLFDQLAPVHELTPKERVILQGAAWLHDIGSISRRGDAPHHKESARLIRQKRWRNLETHEVKLVALVARYHRKALPSADHADFRSLKPTEQEQVRILAALLRLADALDRGHRGNIRDVSVGMGRHRFHILLKSKKRPRREIAAANRKGDLARKVFKRELDFKVAA